MKVATTLKSVGIMLALILQGCKDHDFVVNKPTTEGLKMDFSATIVQENKSRANDYGFVNGDRMGVYVVNYSLSGGEQPGVLAAYNNQASNVAATYNEESNAWSLASDIYWLDDVTPVDVYGYYPYKTTITDVNNYSFEVLADQSVAAEGEMSNYEASDFLWAKSTRVEPTDQCVELKYNHIMAGVKVTLKAGDGLTDTEISKLPKIVGLENVVRAATIDLSTGIAVTSGTAEGLTVFAAEDDCTYRGVIVPQTVSAGTNVISVTLDGVSYHLTRTDDITLQSGLLHNFTVTVNKRSESGDYELEISNEDILPWENDQLSHSFETKAYVVVDCSEFGLLQTVFETNNIDASELKNVKITGQLGDDDFKFIRENCPVLSACDIKDAHVRTIRYKNDESTGWQNVPVEYDNSIPANAFYGLRYLRTVVLPITLEGTFDHLFTGTDLQGTLYMPPSVKIVRGQTFDGVSSNVETNIPEKVEIIEDHGFAYGDMKIEFNIPNTCKYIGPSAFEGLRNVYGTFALPESIEYVGAKAFKDMGTDMLGEVIVPSCVTVLDGQFSINFKKAAKVTLHDGIVKILGGLPRRISNALVLPKNCTYVGGFADGEYQGNIILPDKLEYITSSAFIASTVKFEELPDGIQSIPYRALANTQSQSLTLGDNVENIGIEALCSSSKLKFLSLGKNVETIGENAIADLGSLETLVCKAKTPPLAPKAFSGIEFDKVILEVPESSVNLYRNADGWKQFRNITPHHELAVNIPEVNALNANMEVEGIVRSEGAWKVVDAPSWCRVSPSESSYKKTEVKVVVDEMPIGSGDREGVITIQLNNSNYTTTIPVKQADYSIAEGKEIVLKEANVQSGHAIPLFIVGDGFGIDDITSGNYLTVMNEQMEYFFSIEPLASYRDYFRVSTAIAVSPDQGIGGLYDKVTTKFNTIDNGDLECDYEALKDFIKTSSSTIKNIGLNNSLVLVVANTSRFYGSSPLFYTDMNIALIGISNETYPYDQRALVQYYLSGIALGKLGKESIAHVDFIQTCTCPLCSDLNTFKEAKKRGWFRNLSLSGKIGDAPWSHLIFNPSYAQDVDMWEGGYNHTRGVWRSENASCMATFIPYFNAISRQAIVERIMSLSNNQFDFDSFVLNDKHN
jgi:hypothetical protein